jgi:adenylate cyclase
VSYEPLGSEDAARSCNRLDHYLAQMIERPEDFGAVAAEIEAQFGAERAVLVLDMSGFSRTTQRRGIAALLLMIHQMKRLALPAVRANGGRLVKAEADNLYCVFDDPADAVGAASQIIQHLETANLSMPAEAQLYASIGIGFGRILDVDGEDIFGDEVNLASKLGEDLADRGEILVTAAAAERVPGMAATAETVSVSGLSLSYCRVG